MGVVITPACPGSTGGGGPLPAENTSAELSRCGAAAGELLPLSLIMRPIHTLQLFFHQWGRSQEERLAGKLRALPPKLTCLQHKLFINCEHKVTIHITLTSNPVCGIYASLNKKSIKYGQIPQVRLKKKRKVHLMDFIPTVLRDKQRVGVRQVAWLACTERNEHCCSQNDHLLQVFPPVVHTLPLLLL